MKKVLLILMGVLTSMMLVACANSEEKATTKKEDELADMSWSDIETKAKGTTVRMYMWGGDEGINSYMDEYAIPTVKKQYNITLERVPLDTPEILNQLMNEKKAGVDTGTIDIVWMNGEYFYNAKNNDLLYGPILNQIPNVEKYVDTNALEVVYDFGTETEGMEVPWGKVQFVFQYDAAKVPVPPKNFTELGDWIIANPGKFTYPDPADFTGNAFIRHLFYQSAGGVENILDQGFDEAFATENSQKMWDYLNDIEPYLWREGTTYPNNLTELDRLYSEGEVYMTMGYNEGRAESLIEKGIFPSTTKTFVLDSGSIGNAHFLSIPENSPNKAGAMVVINFLLSPEAQLMKMEPIYWGENMALDSTKLSDEDVAKLNSIDRGESVLPAEILKDSLLPEIDAQYVPWLKENWMNEVVQEE